MINNIDLYRKNIRYAISQNDLTKLNGCSILITGANGMIGSCMVDILNELNETVDLNIKIYALVRNKSLDRFLKYKNLCVIHQDITEKLDFDYHFDYIINAASNNSPQKFSEEPIETSFINYYGTYNLLNYAVNHLAKRFIYVSSGEVYGQIENGLDSFHEEYIGRLNPLDSRSCYPIGKLSAENLCICFSKEKNLDTLIVRPCHIYGPNYIEGDNKASSDFFRNATQHKDIVMKSKGEQIRSYTYVVDCAIGILYTLVYGKCSDAYNIVNDTSITSIAAFASQIAEMAHQKVIFEVPTEAEKQGYNKVTRSVLSGNKLKELGWKPCFDLKDGINYTINILREENE